MKNKKAVIYFIILIMFLIIIFAFSSDNAKKSDGISKGLINKCVVVCEKIAHKNLDNNGITKKLNYPVRKLAHFTEYFVLALIIYRLLFYVDKNKHLIYFNTIMLCIMFASFDEFHQLFVSERTGRLFDICVDSSGSLFALLSIKIKGIIKKKKKWI